MTGMKDVDEKIALIKLDAFRDDAFKELQVLLEKHYGKNAIIKHVSIWMVDNDGTPMHLQLEEPKVKK